MKDNAKHMLNSEMYYFRVATRGEGYRLTIESTGNGHSSSVIAGQTTGESSDGEQDEVESIMLEHSNGSWWNMLTLCKRVFRSHRFRNVQAEVLYQRYFLRMNQNNMASLLALLIAISITMIAVNHITFPSQFDNRWKDSNNVVNVQTNLTVHGTKHISPNISVSDDDMGSPWITTSDGGIVQGATLGVLALMYLLLLILMTRTSLNEVYLIIFSYIILASFFGIEVCFNACVTKHSAKKRIFE